MQVFRLPIQEVSFYQISDACFLLECRTRAPAWIYKSLLKKSRLQRNKQKKKINTNSINLKLSCQKVQQDEDHLNPWCDSSFFCIKSVLSSHIEWDTERKNMKLFPRS
ncbi:hypothetical protein AVEN_223176-1 [Araneus ventricosus]|uniref:Uncharacterized protein n=1 Tax=Araneus ventricosus TaxID=182803 RepID=A0A4Y2FWK1_ARAVE|nr:hypothetical protein AVEN_223176-1 [Araneus ventricosus]